MMYLPFLWDCIQKTISSSKTFFECQFLRHVSKYIDKTKTILDIGANIGNHSIYFSKVLKCKKVVSFEPQTTMQEIFERNMELNHIENVVLNKFPLSDKDQNLSIVKYDHTNFGGTEFGIDENGEYRSKFLDEMDLNDVQFVKMDVEEHELNVLKGGKNLFTVQKPILWIEIHKDSPTRNDVLKLLDEYGYECREILGEMDYLFFPKS